MAFQRANSRAGKLTPSAVYALRLEYEAGATQSSLARKYKISIGQIGRIVRGEAWQAFSNPAGEAQGRYRGEEGREPTQEEIEASQKRLEDLMGEVKALDEELAGFKGDSQ